MSASLINAGMAGELIAPFIAQSWPNDREAVFRTLDLVQEVIWKSGIFDGSSKWTTVKVNKDGTIVSPHGYSVLLGAKIGKQKLTIRDSYFMFHENGPLTEPDESNNFSKNVQFIGTYPTLINHIDDMRIGRGDYKLGVISPCLPPSGSPPTTIISANNLKGRRIYTYRFREHSDPEILEDDDIVNYTPEDVSMQEGIVEGVIYPITSKLIIYDNVRVSEIYNITKEPSLSAVDYYVMSPLSAECSCNEGILVASLDPFQTQSRYSVYKVVNSCINEGKAFCLFKKDRPETLVNDSQLILTNSKNGLIALAKAINFTYNKDDAQKGEYFLGKGMKDIADEIASSNPAAKRELQISNVQKDASTRKFR